MESSTESLTKHPPDLAHLVWMASMPGAKDHAWHRAKEMARTCPELWADMPRLLTEAMRDEASGKDRREPARDRAQP